MPIPTESIQLLRLLHLVSPTLPVGSFSYSQGLEWAVEAGWVVDEESLRAWLESILDNTLGRVDVPLLRLMYAACEREDDEEFERLNATLLACRETRELREEELQRGRALAALLEQLATGRKGDTVTGMSFLGGYARAAFSRGVPCRQAVLGYLWSWLENQVVTGVKIIPLGQTQGQRILEGLVPFLPLVAEKGAGVPLEEVGGSEAALAIGSILHETQYTRLFRS